MYINEEYQEANLGHTDQSEMMAGNLPNNEIYEDKVTNGRQFLAVDHDYRAVLSN